MKMIASLIVSLFCVHAFAQEAAQNSQEASTPKDVKEWTKHTQKLTGYESKVKEHNEDLEKLIKAKNSGQKSIKDEKGREIDILETIVTTHKDLMEAHKSYEEERKLLKYRYPGQGEMIERRYMPLRPPSLNQVEREIGLNGQLTEIREKTDRKYAKFRKAARQNGEAIPTPVKNENTPLKDQTESAPKKRLKLSE